MAKHPLIAYQELDLFAAMPDCVHAAYGCREYYRDRDTWLWRLWSAEYTRRFSLCRAHLTVKGLRHAPLCQQRAALAQFSSKRRPVV
jgi:hypothetical protein